MVSLILVIISFVLVAALAAATLYFGGDALQGGNAQALASTVVNQGEQIIAATRLYYMDKGVVAPDLATLVAENYLTTVPVPPAGLQVVAAWSPVGSAYAADAHWAWDPTTETLALVREITNTEACGFVNKTNNRTTQIFDAVDTNVRVQCYGSGSPYTIIWNGKTSPVFATSTGPTEPLPGDQLCQGAINLGHAPATCGPNATGAPIVAGGSGSTDPGASESGGLRLTTNDPLTFLGATYWVTGELRTVTLTNTSGADQWLLAWNMAPQGDPTWGQRVDVLDSTCPDRLPAGGACTVTLFRPPYSNINRSALATSAIYQPSYADDQWMPIGTPPSLTYQVGGVWDGVPEITLPAPVLGDGSPQAPAPYSLPELNANVGSRLWVTYSTFLHNTVQGENQGPSISQGYYIYIYPTVGSGALDFTAPVGICGYPPDGANFTYNPDDFTADAAHLYCNLFEGTPPGTYQGYRRWGADYYVLCPDPNNPMGRSCSATDYGYYRVNVVR